MLQIQYLLYLLLSNSVFVIGAGYKGGQPIGGCEKGPNVIRNTNIFEQLQKLNWKVEDKGDIEFEAFFNEEPTTTNTKNSRNVGSACSKICNAVKNSQNKFCLTLGGDHSLAIGSIAGMCAVYPELAVVWVDAHADINTPETSPSGNIHGMPVSFLSGITNTKKIPGFEWLKSGCLDTSRLVYIGLRDVDPGEKEILINKGIKAFYMEEIAKVGITEIMELTLAHIGDRPIHLSFDVDGIDPEIVPSTGTRVKGGLSWKDSHYICKTLAQTKKLVGLDVVEVNPDIGSEDDANRTAQVAAEIIKSCLAL